ncbi:hypothetical protein [Glycomyces buryatensis]|uniref:Uncharacterized protein n=1 Tax=Glycomyces buryatensis TaxID=2570927 RepID=A0A4V4HSV9_9ACTN|nr:hypothetical protein [Glycomyces buryatensis]THV42616.1 hypothetical protein FAB82_05460 [Glycomyces buryatensis]
MTRVNEWYWSEGGRERSQINAINELDAELSAHARKQSRRLDQTKSELQSGLNRVQSTVNDRIDTVLEWTELRFQLLEFEEYMARKEIRKAFRALVEGRPTSMPDVDDVLGYWMPPAAMAVLRLIVRDDAAARGQAPAYRPPAGSFTDLTAALESARERDPIRSELFNLTVGLCFEQPAFIDAAVLRLVGEPVELGLAKSGQVAAGWRTLWEEIALGRFGLAAEEQLADQLRPRFEESMRDQDLADWDRSIERFGAEEGRERDRTEAFTALRAHLAEAAAVPEPVAVDADTAVDPRWRRYLQELIEEPSPAELPVVQAMEDLHLPEDEMQRSKPTWSESEGTVAELVRRDLFDPEAPIALRRLALRLAGSIVRERVELLAAAPADSERITRSVKRRGRTVTVDSGGHDEKELEVVAARITDGFAYEGPTKQFTLVLAGIFGALTLLSLIGQIWFLAVLLAIGVVAPIVVYRNALAKHAGRDKLCEEKIAEVRAEIVRARKQVQADERARDEQMSAERDALRELLEALPERSRF